MSVARLWRPRRPGRSSYMYQYVFTVSPRTAVGARSLVRRKMGWRKGIAISQRGSAGPAFLRDKSRAPCQFLARTVNTCMYHYALVPLVGLLDALQRRALVCDVKTRP